jgi:hypothetical protein
VVGYRCVFILFYFIYFIVLLFFVSPSKVKYHSTFQRLRTLHAQGYRIIVISNESTDHLADPNKIALTFAKKAGRVTAFLEQAAVPCLVCLPIRKDDYRKPGRALWVRSVPTFRRTICRTITNQSTAFQDKFTADWHEGLGDGE